MANFNSLPFEIRALIWKLTVEPRTVEVELYHWDGRVGKRTLRLVSSTPVPAPLHVCHEARNMALYKQAFSELGVERRYVWLNFDIDIVSIGVDDLKYYKQVAPMIERLKLERDNEEYWCYCESEEMRNFVNVKEIHVVCHQGFETWGGATERYSWPCALENILFIDEEKGLEIKGTEFESKG
ncbi:hypothetical protein V500_07465 [Pseudogymnoascus sp. VKM F-4518 (FW-2643)]|nr:hypothetical protein V500_07465 [Pseudogymnoascus sp. VKM F-4518 (FW-2643)]